VVVNRGHFCIQHLWLSSQKEYSFTQVRSEFFQSLNSIETGIATDSAMLLLGETFHYSVFFFSSFLQFPNSYSYIKNYWFSNSSDTSLSLKGCTKWKYSLINYGALIDILNDAIIFFSFLKLLIYNYRIDNLKVNSSLIIYLSF
jgi:hypothetical protein